MADRLPADVVRLVIAARKVAYEDPGDQALLRELDRAAEAFADRVPWDDEPEDDDTATAATEAKAAIPSPLAGEGGRRPDEGSVASDTGGRQGALEQAATLCETAYPKKFAERSHTDAAIVFTAHTLAAAIRALKEAGHG